jgi:DNA-directed RNA polymerase specialized sigma24 family protein
MPCSALIRMAIHPNPGFLALVDAHEETMLRAARLLTGDWERAEELLQNTLAWALSKWDTLGTEPAAPLRVRQRLVANYLDDLGPADADDAEAEDLDDPFDEDEELDDEQEFDQYPPVPSPRQGHLLDSLADLDPEDRAVVVARYYLGLSAAEIGEILGADAEEVATAEAHALATLRRVG